MTSDSTDHDRAPALRACTVASDIEAFDGLIDAMEEKLGSDWGELTFEEGAVYLGQPDAAALEFVVLAVAPDDGTREGAIEGCLAAAKAAGVPAIVVAANLDAGALHRMMRQGASDFLPYPLPPNALAETLERLKKKSEVPALPLPVARPVQTGGHSAVIIPVHGLAGGAGATTLAVNLGWELACLEDEVPPRVCVIDLDLQFGSVATYLDLTRKEAVSELMADAAAADDEAFLAACQAFEGKLHVLTAPPEPMPLDFVGPAEIERVLEIARTNFDYVIVDMPRTLVHWTETVLAASTFYLAPLELDLRSAQNALRLIKTLRVEDLPLDKLRFALNRAPKKTDLAGRARAKRLGESLDVKIDLMLPDGGRQAAQAGDHGQPLEQVAPKNVLRREISRLADQIHATNTASESEAA